MQITQECDTHTHTQQSASETITQLWTPSVTHTACITMVAHIMHATASIAMVTYTMHANASPW